MTARLDDVAGLAVERVQHGELASERAQKIEQILNLEEKRDVSKPGTLGKLQRSAP